MVCGIVMEEGLIDDDCFIISNIILSQEGEFNLDGLRKKNPLMSQYSNKVINKYLKKLLNKGSIYEVGNYYIVKKRPIRF